MKKTFLIVSLLASAWITSAQTEVVFYTSKGDFNAEIYDNIVPITAGNFIDLVEKKFYDGVIFHRVIDNFMIQGGDPTGTGSGGPGYSIPDEFDPSLSNLKTTISMANSGPNTGGSQFFINLVDNTYLDYNKPPLTSKHPVFGKVILNFNIVEDIGSVATDGSDRPLVDVVMDSVRVVPPVWTGVKNEANTDITLSVYPNPINSSSLLVVSSKYATGGEMLIHDVLGKEVYTEHIELNSGRNEISLSSVSKLIKTKGMYQMSIVTGTNTQRISLFMP